MTNTATRTHFLTGLRNETAAIRAELLQHPVYFMVNSLDRLRIFMERHVFAVWDFMSLLKALQRTQTCVTVPWVPTANTAGARFINEIVLGEETDEDGQKGFISHFELYREAMGESRASTRSIDAFVSSLRAGRELTSALAACEAPLGVQQFVESTWSFIQTGKPHVIAAAFTFGREDIIPDMFRQFVETLHQESGGRYRRTNYYLQRHIDLDEHTHAPMAVKTMHELCGEDSLLWAEATEAANRALNARIQLWNSVAHAMSEASLEGGAM